jgi:hypothetical protein
MARLSPVPTFCDGCPLCVPLLEWEMGGYFHPMPLSHIIAEHRRGTHPKYGKSVSCAPRNKSDDLPEYDAKPGAHLIHVVESSTHGRIQCLTPSLCIHLIHLLANPPPNPHVPSHGDQPRAASRSQNGRTHRGARCQKISWPSRYGRQVITRPNGRRREGRIHAICRCVHSRVVERFEGAGEGVSFRSHGRLLGSDATVFSRDERLFQIARYLTWIIKVERIRWFVSPSPPV